MPESHLIMKINMFQVEFMIWWLNTVIDLIYAMMKKYHLGRLRHLQRYLIAQPPQEEEREHQFSITTWWAVIPWKHGSKG